MANDARTVADLERKYNFASLLGMNKNIKMTEKSIIKVENELVNMLNALVINLADVLDSQSEISLWFFEGAPSTTTEPYISWEDPTEHYGDIYYDQETGYVYQFTNEGWTRNNDTNLIQAMALTNVELDTTEDHERKVYFDQPSPPYSSGDWWILEDGTLKICQLSKSSGDYEKDDFVVSSKYVATVASKTDDTVTVLKGTVTEISDSYVSITDLATGGRTIINGANISTGQINTNNVSIGNGNVLLDYEGLHLYNGAKVVGRNGLMTTLIYNAKPRENGNSANIVGFYTDYSSYADMKQKLCIDILIPEDFEITKAKIIGYHSPVKWSGMDLSATWGYIRNLKLYKATNINNALVAENIDSGFVMPDSYTYEEILGALGISGWTATTPTDSIHNTEKIESADIKDIFQSSGNTVPGEYQIMIETADSYNPSWTPTEKAARTAYFPSVILVIEGYMTYGYNDVNNGILTETGDVMITENGNYIIKEGE